MKRRVAAPSHAEREAKRAQTALALLGRHARSFESEVRGASMHPALPERARIRIEPADLEDVRVGTVLAFRAGEFLMAHRVVACVRDVRGRQAWIPRGDALTLSDRPVESALVVGVVTAVCDGDAWRPVAPAPTATGITARALTAVAVTLARIDLRLAAAWSEAWVWLANRTTRQI